MDLQNILNPANIILSVIITDVIALILARNDLVGQVIKEWYDKFTFGAFVADVASISFGIFLTLALFKYALPPSIPFNLYTFIFAVVIIQLIHDLIFALIIQNYPYNQNNMIDLFKKYIDENSYKILLVDASMMVSSVLLIYLLYYYQVDSIIIYTLLSFFMYFAMFLIY